LLRSGDECQLGVRFLMPAQRAISLRHTSMFFDPMGTLADGRALPVGRELALPFFESDPTGQELYPRVGASKLEGLSHERLDGVFLAAVECTIRLVGKVLFVFLVLEHRRREVLHFNVTEHPCAAWTSQQIVEAYR
jgi:hypothetical protein